MYGVADNQIEFYEKILSTETEAEI